MAPGHAAIQNAITKSNSAFTCWNNQLPVWTAKKLTEGYFPAAIYMLLFESAPTYFIKSGKRVILPFLCCSPPVVEHCSIFPRWVGERHPLPRPDFLGAQFCFDCSITLSCITWQQRRCISVVEKCAGDEKQGAAQDKPKEILGLRIFFCRYTSRCYSQLRLRKN